MLPKDRKFLSVQVLGEKVAAERTIVDHCVIGEDHQIIESPALKECNELISIFVKSIDTTRNI